MNPQRLLALTGKELRELWRMVLAFAALAALVIGITVSSQYVAHSRPTAFLLSLLLVAAFFAALLAEQQGGDLGTATRRHLLSFPLLPAEVVAAKGLSFLLAQSLLLLVGITGYSLVAWLLTATTAPPVVLLTAACRILLFSSIWWSLELAVKAWPRLGMALGLAVVALYTLGLGLVPALEQQLNVLNLMLFWAKDVPLLGPCLAAALLAGVGIIFTTWVVAVRAVEG